MACRPFLLLLSNPPILCRVFALPKVEALVSIGHYELVDFRSGFSQS
jgi:hypothetical protein